MDIEFKIPNRGNLDPRAEFANLTCELLWQKYQGEYEIISIELKPIYDAFFENVRNIYELVDSQIPLFHLFELKTFGAVNFGWTEDEFKEALSITELACKDYYGSY